MIKDILDDAKGRMDGSLEALRKDLASVRTGRASTSLLDDIRVDYYGSMLPVNQVATLSTPEARMIVISPWDKGAITPIERAIAQANLGVNPQNDGVVIRIVLPPLTEERRKDLVKQAKKKVEEIKVGIRTIRREAKEMIEDALKEGAVAEDEAHKGVDELQVITDAHTKKSDEMCAAKEKEILEF